MKNEKEHNTHTDHNLHSNHYGKLLTMTVVSFIAMYILMYAMVNTFSNVFPNVNQFYMAGLMTSAMVIIELAIMGSMYINKKMNVGIMAVSTLTLVAFFVLIKQQSAVSDKQFLKSMIPHHAGAILMCEEANIKDPEIKRLCAEIVSGQRKEIAEMKSKLDRLKNTK